MTDWLGDIWGNVLGAGGQVLGVVSTGANIIQSTADQAVRAVTQLPQNVLHDVGQGIGATSAGIQQVVQVSGLVGKTVNQGLGAVSAVASLAPVLNATVAANTMALASAAATEAATAKKVAAAIAAAAARNAAAAVAIPVVGATSAMTNSIISISAPVTDVLSPLKPMLGGALNLGTVVLAGTLKAPAEAWDIGTNTGIGQSAADFVYNAGVETKNVMGNAVAGKPLTQGILTGTIVKSAPVQPSNVAGATTQSIYKRVEGATGVKINDEVLASLLTPGAEKLSSSDNIVAKGVGTGLVLGAGLGDWILQNPVQAEGGLSILPIQAVQMVEQYFQKPAEIKIVDDTIPSNPITKGGNPIEKTRYYVRDVSSKPECVGKPWGTAGCP